MSRILIYILALFAGSSPHAVGFNSSGRSVTCAAGNLVYDGNYVYQYDGLNRLVQVKELGSAVID